jgi:hypothetical protein
VTRTLRALIAFALLGAGVLGCSSGTTTPTAAPSVGPSLPSFGSTEEPDVPENFTSYDGGAYSFAYPEEWELVERQGSDGPLVVVEGPVTSAGLPQQFIVATQENYGADMDLVVNAFEFLRTAAGAGGSAQRARRLHGRGGSAGHRPHLECTDRFGTGPGPHPRAAPHHC